MFFSCFIFNSYVFSCLSISLSFHSVADYDKKRRICSLPEQGYNPRMSEEFYRLRSFSICKGRVIKHGDSIASRRSRSPASPNTSR